ncbi:MAG TPA: hypothetical protein VME46_12490 [Acidimicrobiales bacterium]|nr:hypothetical protein [Acidimicrobiales bacterium]
MTEIFEEPPDENEAYESFDEALDDDDLQRGYSGGPEGQRDLDTELVVDEAELDEAGARLDDPEQEALLDGDMDDPDGIGGPHEPRPTGDEGWDVSPLAAAGADGGVDVGVDDGAPDENLLEDREGLAPGDLEGLGLDDADDERDASGGPALEILDVAPEDLDELPDDTPGPDSAHW